VSLYDKYWVARLNPEDAAQLWDKAEPLLAPAIACSGGLFEPEDVKALAWTTDPQHFPRETVLRVLFCGGVDMADYYEMALGETETFAKQHGIWRLRGGGRAGWTRHGFKKLGSILERRIP
jgi:hypothetical protein